MKDLFKAYLKPISAVLIFLFTQLLAGGVITLYAQSQGIPPKEMIIKAPTFLAWVLIISFLTTASLLYYYRMIRTKTFSYKSLRWKHLSLGLAAAFIGIFGLDLLSEQFHLADWMKDEFLGLSQDAWGVIALVFVGPIVEELTFREGVIGTLLRHRRHRWESILISAFLFGLVHGNPAQIPFAFSMGIILGIIYIKTGNILVTSIIHIINNLIAVIEMNIMIEYEMDDISFTSLMGGKLITWCYIFVSLVLCIVFLVQFWRLYHRKHIH